VLLVAIDVLNAAIFIDKIVGLGAEDTSIVCSAVLLSNVTLIRLVPVVSEEVNAPVDGSMVKILVFDEAHNTPVAAPISRNYPNKRR